jgi:hypothetical protein
VRRQIPVGKFEVKGQRFGQQRHDGAILAHEPDQPDPVDFAHWPVEVSMRRTFVPLRRIAALSVAISLFAAPLASAQTPETAPPIAAPSNTALLSPTAFARLVQPPADVARSPVVKGPPRLNLLRQGTAATVRQAPAGSTQAPPQKSWASRHKTALIVCSVIAGAAFILWPWYSTAFCNQIDCG